MWQGYRVILFASFCSVFVLVGCVPIQPEPPVAKEQAPASSAQSSSQATPEPPATLTPEPPDPPTSAAPESPEGPAVAAPAVPASWPEFVDETRGLSISYPSGWLFVDPTEKELAALMEEVGERANSDEIRELLTTSTQAIQQEELFVGLGFQYATDSSSDARFVNNINVIAFDTEGLSLQLIAQLIAAQLDSMEGFEVDSAEMAAGLRPAGVEVVSVRYRSKGALFNQPDMEIVGWQVGVLSPDAVRIVILTFSIRSEDFAELEPLLAEIVQRVQWLK